MKKVLIGIILIYFFIHSVVILYSKNRGEVWNLNVQAIGSILKNQNPYQKYAYAYFPFVLIFLMPFYFFGEIAFGNLFANILASLSIYFISSKIVKKKYFAIISVLIYLFVANMLDFIFRMYNQVEFGINGTTTVIGISFLLASLLYLQKNKILASNVFYGISLASLQLTFLTLPLFSFYYYKNKKMKFFVASLLIFAMITAPFAIWGFKEFFNDTINFQFSREIYYPPLNLSLNGFAKLFDFEFPLTARIIIILALLPFCIKNNSYRELIWKSAVFSLISLFVLMNNLFLNYLLLPFPLFLLVWPSRKQYLIKKAT